MMRTVFLPAVMLLSFAAAASAQDRDTKVHQDRKTVEADGGWLYNDLEAGREAAAKAKKPLLVVIRCIP